jgi:hypothetical protein
MSRTPETCAADLSRELAEAVREGHSRIRRYIGTLIEESGWKKRSHPRLAELDAALRAEGLTTSVNITDIGLPLGAWVRIARSPFPPRRTGAQFGNEKDLNAFLEAHHIETFANVPGLDGFSLIGPEVRVEFGGEERFVDLVFEDPDGTTVVVELEKGDPPDDSVMQLQGYLNAYRQQGAKALRGVLITGIPDNPQHELVILDALDGLRTDFPVEWYTYEVGVTLERVD